MKKIFFLFLLTSSSLSAQYFQEWAVRYSPHSGAHDGNDIVADDSGNVFVTGRSDGEGTGGDYITLKYNTDGVLQWEARYNGTGNGDDVARVMTLDRNNNIYVTGSSLGIGSGNDFVTIKYDRSGHEEWTARYNGSGNGNDNAVGIGVDVDGNVYITGTSTGTVNNDIVTVKYNASGTEQWVKRYQEVADSVSTSNGLRVDKQNNVVVLGTTMSSTGRQDMVTIKYLSDGTEQWMKKYNGPSNIEDYSFAIGADDSSNVYVVGQSNDTVTSSDYVTIKYSSAGDERWTRRYDGYQSVDQPHAIAVDGAGNVVVTGMTLNATSSSLYNYATLKYSSDGVLLWRHEYDNGSADIAQDVTVDRTGNVFVTGGSVGSGSDYDATTVVYTTDGGEQVASRYNGPANRRDYGNFITTDRKGNVYVAGYSSNVQNNSVRDIVTIKYFLYTSKVEEQRQGGESLGINYPNPFSQSSVVNCQAVGIFEVRDMLGRLMQHLYIDSNSSRITIDADKWPNGLYLYSLSDGKNVESRMMMVVH